MTDEEKERIKHLIERCNECKLNACITCDITWSEVQAIDKLYTLFNTMEAEFNRLEELEDNTDMLKMELEKKNKIINLMAEQLTTPIHSKEWVIDYYKREIEKC